VFHSRPLNDLIEDALKRNADLQAAQAALRAAHEEAEAQKGLSRRRSGETSTPREAKQERMSRPYSTQPHPITAWRRRN